MSSGCCLDGHGGPATRTSAVCLRARVPEQLACQGKQMKSKHAEREREREKRLARSFRQSLRDACTVVAFHVCTHDKAQGSRARVETQRVLVETARYEDSANARCGCTSLGACLPVQVLVCAPVLLVLRTNPLGHGHGPVPDDEMVSWRRTRHGCPCAPKDGQYGVASTTRQP